MKQNLHVHFMGICGSGCATIALLAKKAGFTVSGCDSQTNSYYSAELKKENIPVYEGHSPEHLDNQVDLVAVSPAIFDVNPDAEELKLAKARGILITWQEFMGKYLQKGKKVISVSGTHGKTTTTFLTAHLLLSGGIDVTAEGGSVYEEWGSGGRTGKSDWFICEADEFNRNFYHYQPTLAVINNIEMDHPECFRDFDDVLDAFVTFIRNSEPLQYLVINADSKGCRDLLTVLSEDLAKKNIRVLAYTKENYEIPGAESVPYQIRKLEIGDTRFSIFFEGKEEEFSLGSLQGKYNIANAVSGIIASHLAGVTFDSIRQSLRDFRGAKRRFDFVGRTLNEVPVYDDYSHHPTEISEVLSMCKDYYPQKKIVAIFEPHQISRLRLMFDEYADALQMADSVIIGKTHIGREIHQNVIPISKEEWESASPKILYEEDYEKIFEIVRDRIEKNQCDYIVVFGAAQSYKISRYLCEKGDLNAK